MTARLCRDWQRRGVREAPEPVERTAWLPRNACGRPVRAERNVATAFLRQADPWDGSAACVSSITDNFSLPPCPTLAQLFLPRALRCCCSQLSCRLRPIAQPVSAAAVGLKPRAISAPRSKCSSSPLAPPWPPMSVGL